MLQISLLSDMSNVLTCPTCQIFWRSLCVLRALRPKTLACSICPTCQKVWRSLCAYVPKILAFFLRFLFSQRKNSKQMILTEINVAKIQFIESCKCEEDLKQAYSRGILTTPHFNIPPSSYFHSQNNTEVLAPQSTTTFAYLPSWLAIESLIKMVKNAFYFTLKALFVLKIFKFLS